MAVIVIVLEREMASTKVFEDVCTPGISLK